MPAGDKASTKPRKTPARPERKRQARGEAKRQAILDATLRLVADHGLDGVTHRSVAREAGVPLGATTYYFSSRELLLEETLRRAAELDIAWARERAQTLAEHANNPHDAAKALAGIIGKALRDERKKLLWDFSLFIEAARYPQLRAIVREWIESYVSIGAAVVGGVVEGEEIGLDARILNWVIDGIFVDQLAAPEPKVAERVLEPAFERLLVALFVTRDRD
jgi:DNA-binding transcriptional regulator YbjK